MIISRLSRIVAAAVVTVVSVLAISGIATAQDAPARPVGPITQRILDRGTLICGVNKSLQGFGFQNPDGSFSGFDVDYCRAIASAVLGDASKVDFRPLDAGQRQAAIQNGEVDVMVRNTTWTLSRDVDWGAIFGPTIFYDGQGVMALASLGATSINDLNGSTMCVQTGTTTELNITDYIAANSLDIELLKFDQADPTWEAYVAGRCESWTTDKSGLLSYLQKAANPADHVILPETISKEPLAPLSPQSDPQFAEVVAWTVYVTFQAEEFGINSANVNDYLMRSDETPEAYSARVAPTIQRMLGQNNNLAGDYLSVPNDFAVKVISQVGNYAEIYDRNILPLGLNREGTLNALWTNGGLLYSPPFR